MGIVLPVPALTSASTIAAAATPLLPAPPAWAAAGPLSRHTRTPSPAPPPAQMALKLVGAPPTGAPPCWGNLSSKPEPVCPLLGDLVGLDCLEQGLGLGVALKVIPHRLQDLIDVAGQRGLEVPRVQRAAAVVGSQLIKAGVYPEGREAEREGPQAGKGAALACCWGIGGRVRAARDASTLTAA